MRIWMNAISRMSQRAFQLKRRRAPPTWRASWAFQSDTGERVLVMLGGDQSAISGHLKKAIGSRNIRMADPEVVRTTTGYVIGSIPAFGWQASGFRSFLEAAPG